MGFGNSSRWRALEFGQLDAGVHMLGNISEPTLHGLKSQSGDPKPGDPTLFPTQIFRGRGRRDSGGKERTKAGTETDDTFCHRDMLCRRYVKLTVKSLEACLKQVAKVEEIFIFADEFLQLEWNTCMDYIIIWHCLESTLLSQGGPARSDQIVRTGAEGKQQGLPWSCDVKLLGLMIGIDLDMGGNCRSLMTGKQMTRAYSLPWRTNRPLDNTWMQLPSCQFVLFKSRVPEYEKYEKTMKNCSCNALRTLMAVAGGIGASVGNTGSINFDRVSVSGVHSCWCTRSYLFFWGRVHTVQISFQLSHESW